MVEEKFKLLQEEYISVATLENIVFGVRTPKALNSRIDVIIKEFVQPIMKVLPEAYETWRVNDIVSHRLLNREFEVEIGSDTLVIREKKDDGKFQIYYRYKFENNCAVTCNGNVLRHGISTSDLMEVVCNIFKRE